MVNASKLEDRLRLGLRARGLTQAKLADEAGVSEAAVSLYLRGEREPTCSRAAALAEALGVRLEWLLLGTEPMRANAFLVKDRAIAEVDGLVSAWDQPTGPDAEAIQRDFERTFRRGPPYLELPEVVQLAFQNLLARVMHSLRRAGRAAEVADPAWRGKVAAKLLIDRVEPRALRVDGAGYDREPRSHPAWLAAIAEEMERWADGESPEDFELPPVEHPENGGTECQR